jgi:hypothetical protein
MRIRIIGSHPSPYVRRALAVPQSKSLRASAR